MTGSLVSAGLASSLPRLSKLRCDLAADFAAAVATVCFVEFFLVRTWFTGSFDGCALLYPFFVDYGGVQTGV